MKSRIVIHDLVLKALGLLLIVAAVLKGHELLSVPVAGEDKCLEMADSIVGHIQTMKAVEEKDSEI